MKSVRIHSYGRSDLLSFEETLIPVPGENDALIHVRATSVNPVDVAFREGYMTSYFPFTFPLILGLDVAGTVEAVGSQVTNLKVGDAVYARADLFRLGSYAEYVVITATEVVLKPPSLNFNQAASIPHAGLTAWRSLFDEADLAAGQTVLIHAAAGGVGSIAVQLSKNIGAKVFGTASAPNQEFLGDLGVDQPVDYTAVPFEDKIKDVDVVLDTIGGDAQTRSYKCLKPGGILVSLIDPPSSEVAASYGVRTAYLGARPPKTSSPSILNKITNLVEAGKVKPFISRVLPLQEAKRGQDLIATRHTRGKIIMEV